MLDKCEIDLSKNLDVMVVRPHFYPNFRKFWPPTESKIIGFVSKSNQHWLLTPLLCLTSVKLIRWKSLTLWWWDCIRTDGPTRHRDLCDGNFRHIVCVTRHTNIFVTQNHCVTKICLRMTEVYVTIDRPYFLRMTEVYETIDRPYFLCMTEVYETIDRPYFVWLYVLCDFSLYD